MALDAELLAIMACPNCHGSVEHHADDQVIECSQCHYRYPIREDIPVMLIDEATKPAATA